MTFLNFHYFGSVKKKSIYNIHNFTVGDIQARKTIETSTSGKKAFNLCTILAVFDIFETIDFKWLRKLVFLILISLNI